MINKDRIVPITRTDLLTMYANMMSFSQVSFSPIDSIDAEGNFEVATNGVVFADEPVSTFNFSASVTSATVYFVPAYDYAGFTQNGAALAVTGDEVEADGCTLYCAELTDGAIVMEKVSH